MTVLVFGLVLSLMGSLPPGLISLTVAQTALHRGFIAAMVLATGAAGAEFFQALAAVGLSDWFLKNRQWERWFEPAAAPVFLAIAIHMLLFAKPPREPAGALPMRPGTLLIKGVLISAFNMLAIPYWFVYVGWLRVEGWWREGSAYTVAFALGVMLGTVLALALYAWLSDRLMRQSASMSTWANRIIGFLLLAMGVKLLLG